MINLNQFLIKIFKIISFKTMKKIHQVIMIVLPLLFVLEKKLLIQSKILIIQIFNSKVNVKETLKVQNIYKIKRIFK